MKNDKDGNIDFESIVFNEDVDDKTYTYTISEINEGEEYVSYDDSEVTVKVRVIKNEENALTAEVTYVTEEGETDEPVFVNINTRLPKTGDSTNMLMYLLMMSISGGAAILTGRKKKKAESMR